MDKKVLATIFTLTGTIIGAGILGLPYVFAKAGFLSGLFWLIFLGAILIYVNLCLGEVTLRTKKRHQLAGYAKKYLGGKSEKILLLAMVFGIYSALLAYLIGEGQSISKLLPGQTNPLTIGIIFWFIMTLLLRKGLKELKKIETYGVIAIIILIIGIFIKFLPQIKTSNLLSANPSNFTLPFGVVLFALMGFTAVPELREEIRGKEKYFKKAIIAGMLIPLILYIIFSSVFVGILGKDVSEVATTSFGPIITLLGIFTMLTSYFVLSFSLKDTFKYDLNCSPTTTFFFTSLVPLILFLLVTIFKIATFSKILGIGGVISGGITGIMILLITKKAKNSKNTNKNPKIQIPINWTTIIILSVIFIAGIVAEFIR